MTTTIATLYLLPHTHTDIGYSHDPVVTLELHNRFLDRAIDLCERTRGYPEGARFRWTVEVFSSLLRWWEHRGAADHERLRECLTRGEIDIGARYLNGTELYAPEDVAWEAAELARLVALTGYRPATAIQNDVNGFPLAFAQTLAGSGVKTVMMGLNTTMGHSPVPRCSAFHWDVGGSRGLLVWNGWIYNRIKTFCHLDELGERFHGAATAFLAGLPKDYPYDFAATSATIGDNIGPFVGLPEQVRRFNDTSAGIKLRLATFAEFAAILHRSTVRLPAYSGQWPDFWTFGAGAMPQMIGMVRRSQRRLRLVGQIRAKGWANETGGTLTLDRARQSLAYACEHTYDSHSSSGEVCGSQDALRQKAQIQVEAAVAESASMVLLRDHLAALAANKPKQPVSVLLANPHDHALAIDYLSDEKGLLAFATSRQPEHLFQFDREPTVEALEQSATFGVRGLVAPAASLSVTALSALPAAAAEELVSGARSAILDAGGAVVRFGPSNDHADRTSPADLAHPVSWQPTAGVEVLSAAGQYLPFALVEERPKTAFQVHGMADMDPADAAWNPALAFSRQPVAAAVSDVRLRHASSVRELTVACDHGLQRRITYRLDERAADTLEVDTAFWFDADPSRRAYYLAIPLVLPGQGDCEYWVDNCGVWFRAETDQLPGTCNSFYQAYRGVAVSRGGQTVYIASPDSTLFQFGGFTFGQLPSVPLQRRHPFVALWLYNNYWGTNFPSYSPGHLRARLRLQWRRETFNENTARHLDHSFDCDYLTHPVA